MSEKEVIREEEVMTQLKGAKLIQDSRLLEIMEETKLIDPFEKEKITKNGNDEIISYGLSPFGYDLRLSKKIKIFCRKYDIMQHLYSKAGSTPQHIDPKELDSSTYYEATAEEEPILIPPNSYALGNTIEFLEIPDNMTFLFTGKATYTLSGLFVSPTWGEPGWRGHFPIQLANLTPLPILIYPEEGIGQARFFEAEEPCNVSYKGRHQDNPAMPTLPSPMRRDGEVARIRKRR